MSENKPSTTKEVPFFQKDTPRIIVIVCFAAFFCVSIASIAYSGANTPITTTETTTLSTYTQTQINEICMNQYLQNGSATYKLQSCPTVQYVSSGTDFFGFNIDWFIGFLLIVLGTYIAMMLGPRRRFG